jgi:predicted transcriptional regulator
MTYKTGTIGEFMKWTKQVIADPAAAEGMPKRWFDSEEAAKRSLAASVSAESMVKLLSPENLLLLSLIEKRRPTSVRALAEFAKCKPNNLSRTLRKLKEAGIIDLEPGDGRELVPRLVATRVVLDLDLTGTGSVVSVHRPARPVPRSRSRAPEEQH